MKSVLFILIINFIISISAFSQGVIVSKKEIPKPVLTSFKTLCPKLKPVEYLKFDTNYMVSFNMNSKWCKILLSPNGNWILTKIPVNYKDLPESVVSNFEKSKYKDWELTLIYNIINVLEEVYYEFELVSIDGITTLVYYNPEGKMLER